MEKISKHEEEILDILFSIRNKTFYGVATGIKNKNRISRHDLCAQIGYTDRSNRRAIHSLRRKGFPVCSDADGGYWLGTPVEWEEFREKERQAALSRMYPAIEKRNN